MSERRTIRFLLGREPRELACPDPTRTVLDWLRRDERRVGTKEGCAEGDCGACTVVLGRLEGERVRYEAIDACIRFLPTLDGCRLLTVEDLAGRDGALHPVQEALVAAHASQCGFCTPGFVMSLYALHLEGVAADAALLDDALAGNLCRCTGYRPIVEAGLAALADARAEADGEVASRLRELQDGATLVLGEDGQRFFAPASLDELAALCARHPEACILSGATDVGLLVTKQMRRIDTLIWAGRVEELRRIVETEEGIEIGAGATYSEAREVLARLHPDLGELVRRIGGAQIRNAGTIGGNIANGSPIGDMPPPMIALGATLVLNHGGVRRSMPLEDFFVAYGKQDRQPGELVEKVVVPRPRPGALFACYKVSKRFDSDITAVLAAFHLELAEGRIAAARIAYGGMAATPRRASRAEAALVGRAWDEAAVEAGKEALAQDFTPITDWRASAAYRARVAGNLLKKFHLETTGGRPLRLVGAGRLVHG